MGQRQTIVRWCDRCRRTLETYGSVWSWTKGFEAATPVKVELCSTCERELTDAIVDLVENYQGVPA